MSDSNPRLADVPKAFADIAEKGTIYRLTGGPDYTELSESHIQGFAVYKDVYLLTQNRHGKTEGKIYFFNSETLALTGDEKLSVEGNDSTDHDRCYNHPGGIQVIGDYVVIPIQTQDYADTVVQLYSLTGITGSDPALSLVNGDFLLDADGNRINGAFGGVGIAKMGTHFLLAMLDNKTVHFFKSTTADLKTARWNAVSSPKLSDDASEVSLVCDTKGNAYLVAFCVDAHWSSYSDHGYLYSVAADAKSISELSDREFDTNDPGSATKIGPHFRYGASIYFPTSDALGLMTTQRVMQPSCKFDLWK